MSIRSTSRWSRGPSAAHRTTRAVAALLLSSGASLLGAAALSTTAARAEAAGAGTVTGTTQLKGHMQLKLLGRRRSGAPALTGESIVVAGSVKPFVPGERVLVHFYRDGRIVKHENVFMHAAAGHAGSFRASYASPAPGRVRVVAVHLENQRLGLFAAASAPLEVISPAASIGSRGQTVWALQRNLARLHYAIPLSGYFDEATADAVIAFRKVTGLSRVPDADASIFHALAAGEGAFRARFPGDGRHVEADLARQVLVEFEAHGAVHAIFMMSSGKPSTPTVLGHFAVYRKEPGVNAKLMYDSNYFTGGYAIHGYPEVPSYAASHGCLRVPYLDAPAINAWVEIGTPVDVYD